MSNNGAYELEGVIWHQHSNKLMVEILKLWPDKNIPIVDLGCGHNFYCNVLEYAGYKAIGVDSVYLKSVHANGDVTEKRTINDIKYFTGFTVKNFGGVDFNVISIEVGEHIPADKADNYLDNVCSFGGNVLMSWAVPGQAGIGHINCQTNDWVIAQMDKRGYKINHEITASLRVSVAGCHCTWFQNTLMYFTKLK